MEENSESEFNQAVAIIYRLDGLSKLLIRSRIEKNYELMYNTLKSWFSELYSMEKKEDVLTQQKKKYIETTKNHNTYLTALRGNKKEIEKKYHPEENLFEWELSLRQWQQKLGVGMAMKADPRYAMAGR